MELKGYLDRIAYSGSRRPCFATLAALQEAHAQTVPFENLDVQLGRSLTTRIDDAYAKIVNGGRGGWCYEQNGLLGWALSELGFDVTRVSAGVMRDQRGDAAAASHLCLIVECPESPQRYLVDVGFGGSLVSPIPLRVAEYDHAPFKVGIAETDDNHWQFWEDLGDGRFTFDFKDEVASEPALETKCLYLQSDPESSFVQNLVAQQRSGSRHTTLRGKVFTVATAGSSETRMLESASELVDVLAQTFRLDVPEIAGVWPRVLARHEQLFG